MAPGACPGLRVKAQVTESHLMATLPGLGEKLPAPSQHLLFPKSTLTALPGLISCLRLQGSLNKWSCKPRSLPSHRPSGCSLKVCLGTGKKGVVTLIDRGRVDQVLVMDH